MTNGKLEVTIKINELPNDVQTNKDNWKTFELDCDGRVGEIIIKAKIIFIKIGLNNIVVWNKVDN